MTTIIPYVNFNGNCREAMSFYKSCLGGELTLQKIGESPMAAHMPSELASHILHGKLVNNHLVLMGSDMRGESLVEGNTIGLCLNCTRENEMNTFYNNLQAGGQVIMELHQSFWGATYAELTDKFGVNWMLHYSKARD